MPMGFRPLAAPTARAAPGRPIRAGELRVAGCRSERDPQQPFPDKPLKRRARHPQRQVEGAQLAGEERSQLFVDDAQCRVVPAPSRWGHGVSFPLCWAMYRPVSAPVVPGEQQLAHGAGEETVNGSG